MTGDSVSGYAWNGTNGWFADRWSQLTEAMIQANVPWAFALGNHDDQADLNREQIVALDQTYALSRTLQGPLNIRGATNYFLSILSSNQENQSASTNLLILDSNDNNCLDVPGWGCVYPDQVEWYRNQSHLITTNNNGIVVPTLAFFHIPVPEFLDMWNYRAVRGWLRDTGVCCFSINTGLLGAFLEMGDVKSVHCGHDHDNDFFGEFENITLAYGRKTGYGGYGPPKDWLRGARILEIQEEPFAIQTWLRLQDGSIVEKQPLHLPDPLSYYHFCCDSKGSSDSTLEELSVL